MLNEQATSSVSQPVRRASEFQPRRPQTPHADIRQHVSEVLDIVTEQKPSDDLTHAQELGASVSVDNLLMIYEGKLLTDSETAYEQLDALLAPQSRFALFRKNRDNDDAPHRIYVMDGRVEPIEGNPWLNLGLLVATLLSVFLVGSVQWIGYALEQNPALQITDLAHLTGFGIFPRLSTFWRGYPYALSIMAILGAHELGHYFAARRHGHAVSLPYFIPMPISFLGTMGAVIRSREPMRNRKILMDIGAAGPIAGFIFAVPILLIGIATSPVRQFEPDQNYIQEGNSLLYVTSKLLIKGEVLPNEREDISINQMAFAGWLGLLVTALNLIPVGQLDGGHVLYSLFGGRARQAYIPVMLAMVGLVFLAPQVWFIWLILLFFLGRIYAPPLDDITPLDAPRRRIAYLTIAIFVLVFVPRPLETVTTPADPSSPPADQQIAQQLPLLPSGFSLGAETPLVAPLSADDSQPQSDITQGQPRAELNQWQFTLAEGSAPY